MWKKTAYLLIIMGLILLMWPKAREWVDDYKQDKLLRDAKAAMSAQTSPHSREAGYEELSQLFALETDGAEGTLLPDASASPAPTELAVPEGAVAILRISKIDLELPVLEGATKANMKVGAAHMTETTPLGEVGNAAIAAHRARTEGRLFNRLNEIAVGDEMELEMKGKSEVYQVFRVVRVLPTDLSVLDGNGKDRILTLITCDPIESATHRIIVQAKPVNDE
ncbi:class D sortase [Gorillibacterium timonense]|uniref:class D sortase n=1 Tax=Gorillibacterium timonense TaxID=1689269 RepID=UPI00071C6991|nr:class D sortase [Gorillibacterium timonense]